MNPRHLSASIPLRLIGLAATVAAAVIIIVLTTHRSQSASANPAYGSVKLNPSTGFVIQGYKIVVPFNATTCSTPPPTYTPTATATNTATPTRTSTATPITSTPTATPTSTPITATATATFTPTVTQTPFPGTPLPSPTPNPLSICRIGAYEVNVNYDSSKLGLVTDSGTSSGGNTTTTLVDVRKTWKINQWAGSGVTLVAGAGSQGTNGPQVRKVVSNTATTLTIASAWDAYPVKQPDATTVYTLGGMRDGGWIGSTGRQLQCPIGPTYGASSAELHCVTLGNGDGATGTGALASLSLSADVRGLASFSFVVPPASPSTQVLTIEGTPIPADVVSGSRRVTLCPDPNADGRVNSSDLLLIGQQQNKRVGQAGYTVSRDPNEDGIINSTDLLIAAGLQGKKCIQP